MQRHTQVQHFLERSAARFPDKVALVHHGRRLTYAGINVQADRIANALRAAGVKRGDRVVVYMDNSVEAVLSIFAILKTGAAFIVVNHTSKAERLEFILNNSRSPVLMAQGSRLDMLGALNCPALKNVFAAGHTGSRDRWHSLDEILIAGDSTPLPSYSIDLDLAAIIYTSGSTAFPKGVMLSHLNMITAAHSITTYLENCESDVIMNMLPLSFDYGLYQVLMAFLVGGTVVLENSFTYPHQVIETMKRENVTGFPGVPSIFALWLSMKDIKKYDLPHLRYITNTAAALPIGHIKQLRELFPHVRIYSMYGLTECKRVSYLPPEELDRRPGSIGKGMPNEEVFVVSEQGERAGPGVVGELVVRGSNVMLGYWELPEETARYLKEGNYPGERVLYTGDLFTMDDEGFFYFVARKDDIIKCGGEKVSPREIEHAVYGVKGVIEAAAIGVSDAILGQAIMVAVSVDPEAGLTENAILRHCSQHLEALKVPKYIEIMEALPRTESGKVNKRELMGRLAPVACGAASDREGPANTGEAPQTILRWIGKWAVSRPDAAAVVMGGNRVAYGDLNDKIGRFAAFLAGQGLRKGECVCIMSENSPEFLIAYFGVQKAGGIAVGINSQYTTHEVRRIIAHCHPAALMVEHRRADIIANIIDDPGPIRQLIGVEYRSTAASPDPMRDRPLPDGLRYAALQEVLARERGAAELPVLTSRDIAAIIYTSGTTGDPKGVMLSHGNFLANAASIVSYLGLSASDSVLAVLPFYYSYGMSLATTHLMAGGTLFLENRLLYPNVLLDKMVEEGITGFAGVPSTFAILLNRSNIRNYRFPKLRYVTQAGGPMPPRHARLLSETLPEAKVFIMYGQTEATARLTYLGPDDLLRKPGSIGKAIPNVTIELITEDGRPANVGEEGEIVACGDNIMAGYWNDPADTARTIRNGRLFTGDMATRDDEGYLYIVGRKSDMIKSGAHRISPKEIEEVIHELDGVQETTVIGVPDEILGESIKAFVVLRPGLEIKPSMVQRHCQKMLAPFKVPKEVAFVPELPKTGSGKIRRHVLREQHLTAVPEK